MKRRSLLICCIFLAMCVHSTQAWGQVLTWRQPGNPLRIQWWSNVAVDEDLVLLNTTDGIVRTHVNGGPWKVIRSYSRNEGGYRVAAHKGMYLLGQPYGSISKSTDRGVTWKQERVGTSDVLFVGCTETFNAALLIDNTVAVQRRNDTTWRFFAKQDFGPLVDLYVDGDSVFIASKKRILRARYSDTLLVASAEIPDTVSITSVATLGGVVICGTEGGAYRSVNEGRSWTFFMPGDTLRPVQVSGRTHLTAVVMMSAFESFGWVYRSLDSAHTWNRIPQFPIWVTDAVSYNNEVLGMDVRRHLIDAKPHIDTYLDLCATPVQCPIPVMAPHPQSGFVVCFREPFKRINDIHTWLQVTLPPITVTDAAYVNDRLLAVGEGAEMAVSDDGGLSWFPLIATGLPRNVRWKRLFVTNDKLVLHGSDSSVYMSRGMDLPWMNIMTHVPEHVVCFDDAIAAVTDRCFIRMQFSGNGSLVRCDSITTIADGIRFAGSVRSLAARDSGFVYVLTDEGRFFVHEDGGRNTAAWTERPFLFSDSVAAVRGLRNAVYALQRPLGLFRSRDNGRTWESAEENLKDGVVDLKSAGNMIWASTLSLGMYFAIDDALVSVRPEDDADASQSLLVPQPASHLVRSDMLRSSSRVTVISSIGSEVRVLPVLAGGTLDVSSLREGMYMLRPDGANTPSMKCMVWR